MEQCGLEKKLRRMPQVYAATGVSGDYINEYYGHSLMFSHGGMPALHEWIDKYPVKRYLEHFPEDEYEIPVDDRNRERIRQLDEIADRVNSKEFSAEEYWRMMRRVNELIRGRL